MYSLLHSGAACCGQCKYFKVLHQEDEPDVEVHNLESSDVEYGRCVRYPPVLFHPTLLNAEFPVVSAAVWCGEFSRSLE